MAEDKKPEQTEQEKLEPKHWIYLIVFFGVIFWMFSGGDSEFVAKQYEANVTKLGEEKADFIRRIQNLSSEVGYIGLYRDTEQTKKMTVEINISNYIDSTLLTDAERIIFKTQMEMQDEIENMAKESVEYSIRGKAAGDNDDFLWVVTVDYDISTIKNMKESQLDIAGSLLNMSKNVKRTSNTNAWPFITEFCKDFGKWSKDFCYKALN